MYAVDFSNWSRPARLAWDALERIGVTHAISRIDAHYRAVARTVPAHWRMDWYVWPHPQAPIRDIAARIDKAIQVRPPRVLWWDLEPGTGAPTQGVLTQILKLQSAFEGQIETGLYTRRNLWDVGAGRLPAHVLSNLWLAEYPTPNFARAPHPPPTLDNPRVGVMRQWARERNAQLRLWQFADNMRAPFWNLPPAHGRLTWEYDANLIID